MEKQGIDTKITNKLHQYLKEEEFDTDAIDIDVIDHQIGSNILILAKNGDKRKFAAFVIDYIEEKNRM